MNPWYAQLVDDCMAEHDRVCLDGAECPERETHTMAAYVTVALRERVETLQGQVGRVRVALSNYPRACEKHPDDDVIRCGWKSAVLDVQNALEGPTAVEPARKR